MTAISATGGAAELASGKGHKDENFPVASMLVAPRYRAPIMAFYRFARLADDIADHPTAAPADKLARLEAMRASVAGEADNEESAVALRHAMAERGIDPVHALDLLEAFRRDVTKLRYATWGELLDYCRYSAAPVGRFVLDVHGEDRALWPANDALCSALQIINHLQDCGKDYREINRVYLPEATLREMGATIEDLGGERATKPLRNAIACLAHETRDLLEVADPFSAGIRDRRLAVEVAVIDALAWDLEGKLEQRDPLSQRVHHSKPEALWIAAHAAIPAFFRRRPR